MFPEPCKRLRNASVKELPDTEGSALLPVRGSTLARFTGW